MPVFEKLNRIYTDIINIRNLIIPWNFADERETVFCIARIRLALSAMGIVVLCRAAEHFTEEGL